MSETDPFPPLIHGRYKYLEEIGRGGMGRVVLVEDLRYGCHRALKWVEESGEASTAEAIRQLREFQILSRFDHPNLLRVFEYGRAHPRSGYFFTSEVLTGPSLRHLISAAEARVGHKLLIDLFRALSFIHRHGWVHGDIKPDNLRMRAPLGDPRDDLCLLDFGLAHPEGRPPEEKILGTVHYMPPERLLGGRIDRRGDLYSAGVLAFQILTGQLPFGGSRKTEVFEGHLRRPPPDPRQLAPGTPNEIANLLFSLLEKRPEDRPADVEEVLAILRDHWDGIEEGPDTTETLVAHAQLREEAIWDGPVAQIERRVRERCGEGGPVFRGWMKTSSSETSTARPMRAASISSSAGAHGMLLVEGAASGDLRLFRAEILRRLQVQGHTVLRWNARREGALDLLAKEIDLMTSAEMKLSPEAAELPDPTVLPASSAMTDDSTETGSNWVEIDTGTDSVAGPPPHAAFDVAMLESSTDSRDYVTVPPDSESSVLEAHRSLEGPTSAIRRRRRRKATVAETPQMRTLSALAHLARHAPVTVVVDGLTQGTPDAFSVLVEAIAQERRLPGLDRVVWVALLDDQRGAWFSEWRARSDVQLWTRAVALPVLDAEGVEALLSSRFPGWVPEPEVAARLLEDSEGSPSQLERNLVGIVRAGIVRRPWGGWEVGELPPVETSPIVDRTRHAALALAPELRMLLEALAVADHPLDPVEMQRLAGSPAGKTPELLTSLLQKKWLARDLRRGVYHFVRPFQAIAVNAIIGPERRQDLHRAAGDLLESNLDGRGTVEQWSRLSRHRIEAGQLPQAWIPLIQFVERGAIEGDPSEGIRRAEKFIELDSWRPVPGITAEHRGVLHDALGMLRLRQGDVAGAERDWRHAERYFQTIRVSAKRNGRLQARLGSLFLRRGATHEALPRLRASLKALRGKERGDLLRRHLVLLAEINLIKGEPEASHELWGAFDTLGAPESPTLDAEAVLLRADHSIRRGHVLLAREQLLAGLARIEYTGPALAGWVAFLLGRLASLSHQHAAARQQYRLAASLFQKQQQPLWESKALIDLAETLREARLMGEAERAILRAERQQERSGARSDRPRLLWLRSSLLADGGWVKEARTSLIELADWGDVLPRSQWRWEASLLEAELMLRMGNLARASQLLAGGAHPRNAPHGHLGDVWVRWSILATRLGVRRGYPQEALSVSDEALAEARERCDATGLAPIWRERIRTLRTLGCLRDADRLEEQLRLPAVDRAPNAEAGGEELAEHLSRLAMQAESLGQQSAAAIHYEEALFHALRVRALPLGAILPLRLALLRARDDRGSEMAARQAWRRLVKSDLAFGRVEVLCLWARARERADDPNAAASLRRAAVRQIARWSEKIPLDHDLLTLAKGLRADPAVLEAIEMTLASTQASENPPTERSSDRSASIDPFEAGPDSHELPDSEADRTVEEA